MKMYLQNNLKTNNYWIQVSKYSDKCDVTMIFIGH